ncbi:MAG: long-chain-fatty-acid--CoA ligase [Deltaproteobacteria bacterium]
MQVPLLVNEFLARASRLYGDKTAIVDGAERFTYAEFHQRANQLSHALRGLGVEKGDRVCMLSPNSHFFLESFYATSQIGAVLVPLNYRLVAEDHEYILNHAGVKVVLVDREYTDTVDQIRPNLTSVEHWVTARQPDHAAAAEGWLDWDELICGEPGTLPEPPELDENDLLSINYTSGTTARPKGVMLTHRNLYVNAWNLIAHMRIDHDDVELWTLPMFHCNGWGGVYAMTGMGGTHVVLRAVDGAEIWKLIEAEKVTFACMAPAVLRAILDYPDRDNHQISTKPRFVIAGAPPPSSFIEQLETELGWNFLQIYGLTETAPLLTISKPDYRTKAGDWPRRARAGVQGLNVEMVLLDDAGREVPQDDETVGEVCARSNVVFAGYWRQPEETAEAIRDGFFHTGDLGVWDATRSIHIVDRKKDVIISGGENISSPEIEDALFRNDKVLECAVIGVPHEKWGETPKALIVLREGHSLTEAEVIAFCRERLAHFKCPTIVEFVEALPRTATGKLQKFRLREEHWGSARKVN